MIRELRLESLVNQSGSETTASGVMRRGSPCPGHRLSGRHRRSLHIQVLFFTSKKYVVESGLPVRKWPNFIHLAIYLLWV